MTIVLVISTRASDFSDFIDSIKNSLGPYKYKKQEGTVVSHGVKYVRILAEHPERMLGFEADYYVFQGPFPNNYTELLNLARMRCK